MKVNTILTVEWATEAAKKKNLKNPGFTRKRILTFAMTRRNALSTGLIKPTGEQVIVSS